MLMKPYSVLIVDDEQSILRSLQRVLRNERFHTWSASDAQTALEILGTEPIDIIISDQRMPGMSGTELLTKVKERYPGVIRILFSGYSDFESIISAINDASVYKFISKPWDNKALVSLLDEVQKSNNACNIAGDMVEQFLRMLKLNEKMETKIIQNEHRIELVLNCIDDSQEHSVDECLDKMNGLAEEIEKSLKRQECNNVEEIDVVVYRGDEVLMKMGIPTKP